jgi:hypothetical protein
MNAVSSPTKHLCVAVLAACSIGLIGVALRQARAQTSSSTSGNTAKVTLQSYTAPDRSASVGVPAGWKVTKGANGVIQMSGPQGEEISLGNGVYVRNGPFQLGQKASGNIAMTMPYQATLVQKYAMLWQQAAAQAGDPTLQVSLSSATPVPLGNVAQCGIFLGSKTDAKGSSKFESRFCSLAMDSNGIFKLFWMNADIPAAVAAQERATAEAVLASYKPSQDSLKLILMPATPPLPPPGSGGESSAMYAARMANESSTCMDEAVIREVPERLLPPYCR